MEWIDSVAIIQKDRSAMRIIRLFVLALCSSKGESKGMSLVTDFLAS